MKLNKVIYRALLLATLLIMVFSMLITLSVLNFYFTDIERRQLVSQTSLIGRGCEYGGADYLDEITDSYRITWIAADGAVLYDNTADASLMENHLDREEISEALRYGYGESERYSDTIGEKTVYEARRLSDGSVIRVSFTTSSIMKVTAGMLPYLVLVTIVAMLLSLIISQKLSERILKPLNSLNLDEPLENEAYEELAPLLVRIDSQNRQINSQLDELRSRQQEFSAITRNMNEGLILLNNIGNIVSINRAACRILSADPSCVGHNLLVVERSIEVQDIVREGKEKKHAETTLCRDGRIYQVRTTRVLSEGGNMAGLCLLIVDETEKASAEAMRREFSANVSHELKTPLHSILASSELLENNLVKSEDVPLFVSRIHKEAEHLVTLIEDIIRLSQLDETVSFPTEEINMRELTAQVIDSLQSEAAEKKVTLVSDVDELTINGVKRLIYEILFNLTDNAVRYNRIGGHVRISFHNDGKALLLQVADDGIGIASEHFSRIFERFYRVDKSHSRETGGTGLGLSIVKHAAIYHKGEVSIESELGKGTVMSVRFPLSMLA